MFVHAGVCSCLCVGAFVVWSAQGWKRCFVTLSWTLKAPFGHRDNDMHKQSYINATIYNKCFQSLAHTTVPAQRKYIYGLQVHTAHKINNEALADSKHLYDIINSAEGKHFQLCLPWWPLQHVFLPLPSGFWDMLQHPRWPWLGISGR